MFVAYSCDGCTAAPLTEYVNKEIFQELPKEWNYFTNTDERLYIDMRRSKGYTDELEKLTWDDTDLTLTVKLKAAATKNWGWESQVILRQNIITLCLTEAWLCPIKTTADLKKLILQLD